MISAKETSSWPRVHSFCIDCDGYGVCDTVRKLGFLRRRLAEGAEGIGAVAMRSLVDEPNSLSSWRM